ncbi:MAG TPA: zinc ribbon domain-containing protein [Anaerolineales bacterium]|nr:zinc ribbon domain-containing protein [Anaerolineales bacterium]
MRRWFVLLSILGIAALPLSAHAQGAIQFSTVQVELRPEYDQPSMLAIYDLKLADSVGLPVDVTFHFPKGGNLVAVAFLSNGQLMTTDYSGPTVVNEWKVITISVKTATTYHVEYYEPITRNGKERQFNYGWISDYPINDFSLSLLSPPDITQFTADPPLNPITNPDGTQAWEKDFGALPAKEPFTLNIKYDRSSDKLSVPQSSVEPSQPIGSNTPGSFMSTFSGVLPYVLGGLGLLLIGGGIVYFWQSGQNRRNRSRRRHAPRPETEGDSEVYCHQCGGRAHKGDRFCRVCGTKLRREA